MGLVGKILAETIETSLRVLPMVVDHLLEVKGEIVYQRIKTDIALSCLPKFHNAVVIDTKTEQWKTAENLVEEGIACLKNFGSKAEPLREVARFFLHRSF